MKIDKLLKGYARHRRESAGSKFELHAATRHLLQGEAARTYRAQKEAARPGSAPAIGRWRWFARSSGVVACFVLVLAVMYPVLFPKTELKNASLARLEKPALLESRKQADKPVARSIPPSASAPAFDAPVNGPVEAKAELKQKTILPEIETLDRRDANVLSLQTKEIPPQEPKVAEEPTLLTDRSDRRPSSSRVVRRTGSNISGGRGMLLQPSEKVVAGIAVAAPNTNDIAAGVANTASQPVVAGNVSVNTVAAVTDEKNSLDKLKTVEKGTFENLAVTGINRNAALNLADVQKTDELSESAVKLRTEASVYNYSLNFSNQSALVPDPFVTAQAKDNNTAELYMRQLSNTPAPVLNTFQLRQQGENITIIDADGSIYKGRIMTEDATAAASKPLGEVTELSARFASTQSNKTNAMFGAQLRGKLQNNALQQAQNGISFQAAGSNRLHQNVAIQGQIVGLNNSLVANSLRQNSQAAPPPGSVANSFFSLSNNATTPIRIQGQVLFGDTNRLEIDAIQQIP